MAAKLLNPEALEDPVKLYQYLVALEAEVKALQARIEELESNVPS